MMEVRISPSNVYKQAPRPILIRQLLSCAALPYSITEFHKARHMANDIVSVLIEHM